MAEETTLEPQKEKQKKTDKTGLAILALTVIIVAVITVFLVVTYYPQAKVIAEGDCVDLNYIGRYASNNTIFDSSYNDTTNKTGGTPLNIFVTMNKSSLPPTGYEKYSQEFIDGLMERLVDLHEGQTTTIGPIPPEKAYGAHKLAVGDIFSTQTITASNFYHEINQSVQVMSFTEDGLVLKWMNPEELIGNFTMPEAILMADLTAAQYSIYDSIPPYYIWENSSEIVNITDTTVMIKTTPTTTNNLTKDVTLSVAGTQMTFVFPDASTATWNETAISLTSSPVTGANYIFNYSGTLYDITIGNITADHVNISVVAEGQEMPIQLNRTITFNRIYEMPRLYTIPSMFEAVFSSDLEKAGYSLNNLAGESLLFEVTIEKVYKTSE